MSMMNSLVLDVALTARETLMVRNVNVAEMSSFAERQVMIVNPVSAIRLVQKHYSVIQLGSASANQESLE